MFRISVFFNIPVKQPAVCGDNVTRCEVLWIVFYVSISFISIRHCCCDCSDICRLTSRCINLPVWASAASKVLTNKKNPHPVLRDTNSVQIRLTGKWIYFTVHPCVHLNMDYFCIKFVWGKQLLPESAPFFHVTHVINILVSAWMRHNGFLHASPLIISLWFSFVLITDRLLHCHSCTKLFLGTLIS